MKKYIEWINGLKKYTAWTYPYIIWIPGLFWLFPILESRLPPKIRCEPGLSIHVMYSIAQMLIFFVLGLDYLLGGL